MSIRWKFLLILLGFSIIPLIVFAALNFKVALGLGEDFGDLLRWLSIDTGKKGLLDAAVNHARNLDREMGLAEEVLRGYAGIVEIAVVDAAPEGQKRLFPHGVATPEVARSMPQLHSYLAPLHGHLDRQHIALAGDAAVSYPSASGEAGGSRAGSRFEAASAEAGDVRPRWILPEARSSTGDPAVMTVGLPLRRADGCFAGHVALDIDLTRLLEKIRPAYEWSPFMVSWLVSVDAAAEAPDGLPRTLAIKSPAAGIHSWAAADSPIAVGADSHSRLAGFLAEAKKWPRGHATFPFNGEPALWAYAAAGNGLVFVHALPQREGIYRLHRSELRLRRWYSLDALLITVLLVLVLAGFTYHRSQKMIDPILRVVQALKRLSEGDFSARLRVEANDERRMVADAFNAMAEQIEDRMRIRQALEVAREVQQNFLPVMDLSLPGFEVAARLRYCDETGGDYIDLITTESGKTGIVVSDVVGHGVGAALLMATARALVRGKYGETSSLDELLNSVNRKLSADIRDTGRFMTLFFLELDWASRGLQWIRAGHDPGWLITVQPPRRILLDGPGLALGVDDRYEYAARSVESLNPGDLVVIGTDGIWETRGPDGSLFGKDRLEELVVQHAARSAAEVCDAVMAALADFRGEARQMDDVSIVAVKALPPTAQEVTRA